MSNVAGSTLSGSIVQIDEVQVRGHVDEVVRRSVEETLKRRMWSFLGSGPYLNNEPTSWSSMAMRR